MDAHLFRIALSAPFAAGVLEIADQFLLLRIDGYGRLVLGHRRLDRVVNHPELRVAVGVVGALAGLAIGLQAELLLLQQLADNRVADFVPEFFEFGGQPAQTLARPAQATSDRRARRARPARSDRPAIRGSFASATCVHRQAGASDWALAEAAHRAPSDRVRSCWRRCA